MIFKVSSNSYHSMIPCLLFDVMKCYHERLGCTLFSVPQKFLGFYDQTLLLKVSNSASENGYHL